MKSAHGLVTEAKARAHGIALQDATAAILNAEMLIDVRQADELHAGHIPGAINIPRSLLEFKLSNDPQLSARDLKRLLNCKNSGRSALAVCSLGEMGYLQVQSISGGFEAWSAAAKPVPHNPYQLLNKEIWP